MLFVLVLGVLVGGAAAVLLGQWYSGVLVRASAPRSGALPRPTLPEPNVARRGGLVFVPGGRRRAA